MALTTEEQNHLEEQNDEYLKNSKLIKENAIEKFQHCFCLPSKWLCLVFVMGGMQAIQLRLSSEPDRKLRWTAVL